jgi:Chemotaxis phosphatase CheX
MVASVLAEDAAPVWDDLPAGPQSTARLAIHDELDGHYLGVVVRLGLSLARVVASRMMSVADPTGDDVLDAVGELGNIAGGNVKSLLCQHARLSLPAAEMTEGEIDGVTDGVRVRAVVLGQVIELAVSPTITSDGLLWPPYETSDTAETL